MYQLNEVTQTYHCRGKIVTALNSIDISIEDNEFLAIVGPSGSGKTTLLSVLGGMLKPEHGEVLFDGDSLYDLPLARRAQLRGTKIGFVFQTFNLVPWLTALENVQIPMMLGGFSSKQQIARASELLERVGLHDRIDHHPGELSQGQQQRVALARTLANDPQVILADEPTGNLDHETRHQVMEYLAEFHRDGRTIILVTHDADTAAFANRTLRLVHGAPHSNEALHAA
ncbi:ABC transporter ATP-binding protein [Allorhodopirellula solitaria]|uniref:Lipoprotein-releasing system ATP-binding protein LolD n=1 Tax=Allorhodopirellula solitaria TaxID=2527987 RepID=A0A5C5XUY6_9BACT|nr:ABC transporter ATP-binding protein [Allorhodopirellula solitaria]TWT66381.1 Lipoprotein-releasing system ATP-binding protein LolD [Allorhodopirellula solitaria]